MSNRFTKSLCSFSLILIFTVFGTAQSNCGLTSAPDLFNLHLRMSPEQAQAVIGNELKIKIKKKGERIFFQNFIENPAPVSLQGVRATYLRFYDLKLYQIEIFYEEKSGWETLESFTAALSVQKGFSDTLWHNVRGKALIDCGDFTILADKILNPHIEITDESIRKMVELNRQKK